MGFGDHPRSRVRGGVPVSRSSAIAVPVRSLFSSETALLVVLTGYIVVLGLWPLARLFVESLLPGTSGEVLGLLLGQWRSAATQRALINTLESSLLATVLSVAIGTTAAFVLTLTDVRGQGGAHLRRAAAAARALADHRAGLDRAHRRRQPDPRPARPGARAGRDQSALFDVGHRAGDGHRKLDARVPRGARGAAQRAARPGRGRPPWRRASAARHAGRDHAARDAGDPRRRGARLRHLDRQFRHPGDARHPRPLHRADHADLSAAAGFRPARAGRGRGAGADPHRAGGGRASAARAHRAPRRLCGRRRKRAAHAVPARARARAGRAGAVDRARLHRGPAAARAARIVAGARARRAAARSTP